MTSKTYGPFATAAEVAGILGVTRSRVLDLAASTADFPLSERSDSGGLVWPRAAIESWAVAHPDRGPRYPGQEVPSLGAWSGQVGRVAELAADEGRMLNHDWVGQDHLVLALLHPDCPGAARTVLTSLGVVAGPLREAFVESLGDPFEAHQRGTTWSPAAQLLLERATLEAVRLADAELSSEHVLLALTHRWDGSFATRSLQRRGIDPPVVRRRVLEVTERLAPAELPSLIQQAPEPDPTVPLDLAPTPVGHDPRRRKPWGSRVFADAQGRPVRDGVTVRQYFVDRDGNPVLTSDGRPVHVLVDQQGQPLMGPEGSLIRPVEIPPGSEIRTE